jgi:flagellar biosynthetic protein FliO
LANTNRPGRRALVMTVVVIIAALIGLTAVDIAPGKHRAADVEASLLMPGDATAPTASKPAGTPTEALTGSAWPSIIKMISALCLVVLAIYGSIWLLKRLTTRGRRGGRQGLLEVIETAYLGPKRSVSLVRVAGKSVLIGTTDNQISMLTELSEEETTAVMSEPPAGADDDSFRDLLSVATRKMKSLTMGKRRAALQE